jgi:cation diffusion facilitator family transporter
MQEKSISNNETVEKKLKWASRISVVVSIFVLSFKTMAYFQTNSQAVLSDALESIVNVLASIVALWIIHVSSEPADDQHPYGHGKLEYFSAAFEGGLVCFAGVMIIAEAMHALVKGQSISNFETGIFYSVIASLLNLGLGLYLTSIGKKHHSAAMISSGTHVLSDLWTTAGSLIGLGLVWVSGWIWIDATVALLMAVYLLLSGYKVVRSAFGGLLDEQDEESFQKLAAVLEESRFPGIIDIHQTRMIRAGRFHHIDAHVVVPEFWDVSEAHHQTTLFENKVVRKYHLEGEIAFHVDPCLKSYCDQCDLEDCPIRSSAFEKRIPISAISLTQKPLVEDEGL